MQNIPYCVVNMLYMLTPKVRPSVGVYSFISERVPPFQSPKYIYGEITRGHPPLLLVHKKTAEQTSDMYVVQPVQQSEAVKHLSCRHIHQIR